MFDESNRESVINKDLKHRPVFQSDEQSLPGGRSADDADVPNDGFEYPLPDFASFKIVQLQALLLTEYDVH